MADTASVTTFVMGAQVPWPDDSLAPSTSGAFDTALVRAAGSSQHFSIRKISSLGATLVGEIGQAAGDEVVLELASGHRAPATVEWAKGGETGVCFRRPLDVLALINRNLVSQPAERRAMPRVEIRCGGFLKRGEEFLPVTIRNISAAGLQVESNSLPAPGSYVSIFIEGLSLSPGEIAWRKGNLAGIALMEALRWSSIMPWIRDLVRREAN